MKDDRKGIGEREIAGMSVFLKAMAEPTRLRILLALSESPLCVMHISGRVGMSQSAVSHQLALLRRANLVSVVRNGKSLVYSLADDHVRLMLDMARRHEEHLSGKEGNRDEA